MIIAASSLIIGPFMYPATALGIYLLFSNWQKNKPHASEYTINIVLLSLASLFYPTFTGIWGITLGVILILGGFLTFLYKKPVIPLWFWIFIFFLFLFVEEITTVLFQAILLKEEINMGHWYPNLAKSALTVLVLAVQFVYEYIRNREHPIKI